MKEADTMGSMIDDAIRVGASPQRWSGVTIDAAARNSDKPNKPDTRVTLANHEQSGTVSISSFASRTWAGRLGSGAHRNQGGQLITPPSQMRR